MVQFRALEAGQAVCKKGLPHRGEKAGDERVCGRKPQTSEYVWLH